MNPLGVLSTSNQPGGRQMPHDITVDIDDRLVATVEFSRPPHNHFDAALISGLADAYEQLVDDDRCRAIVLCSAGRHFCAGADFGGGGQLDGRDLYAAGLGLFAARTPVIAAVQGSAIGGGLGLALSADFRVATAGTRLAANFA